MVHQPSSPPSAAPSNLTTSSNRISFGWPSPECVPPQTAPTAAGRAKETRDSLRAQKVRKRLSFLLTGDGVFFSRFRLSFLCALFLHSSRGADFSISALAAALVDRPSRALLSFLLLPFLGSFVQHPLSAPCPLPQTHPSASFPGFGVPSSLAFSAP